MTRCESEIKARLSNTIFSGKFVLLINIHGVQSKV